MRRRPKFRTLLFLVLAPISVTAQPTPATAADPFLWLEDVSGERSLAWAREQNAVSQRELEASPDSPYQNVREGVKYPRVLFTTSTRDDRVHPGHARKMVARMLAQKHDVLYYENIEGGHGGAANNKQSAYMSALAYTFLLQQLR
jgi:prolyl oligopeptidase PreP (S9A serine peptidase family)